MVSLLSILLDYQLLFLPHGSALIPHSTVLGGARPATLHSAGARKVQLSPCVHEMVCGA